MLSLLSGALIFSVLLPDGADIPTVSAGESALVELSSGQGWFRILEDDYVCLAIGAIPGVSLTAHDVNGSVLCQSEAGSGMVLSAFADYWFYILLTREEGSSADDVTITPVVVDPEILSSRRETQGSVDRNEMAQIYTFSPESAGNWTFRLEGSGGADLDLEVYGPSMRIWGSSTSLEGFETVTVPVLPDEEITAVVSRYSKGGSGEYTFSARSSGDFPLLPAGRNRYSINLGEIHRYLISADDGPALLDLAILSPGADIDITLRDVEGEYLMGSQSYYPVEALLLPQGEESVVEVLLFDSPDGESVPYSIARSRLDDVHQSIPAVVEQNSQETNLLPVGFAPGREGLYRIEVLFDKTRDGDVSIFRGPGEPSLTFASQRGDEEFLLWVSDQDTVWVYPFFQDFYAQGKVTVSVTASEAPVIDDFYSGTIGTVSSTQLFATSAPAGTILGVDLSGENREVDIDLLLSGPGIDLVAEGWLSNVDAAGDEAIAVYSEDNATFGITAYLYQRDGETPFSINVNRIDEVQLADPSPQGELWALFAGISGYPSAADILNRASMDAVEMYDFLVNEQQVPPDHVILLVDAMATREKFLECTASLLEVAGPEDRVLLFFSGHGDQSYPGSGGSEESDSANESICLYDDDISDDTIAGLIDSLGRAPIILFFDACHSGGFVNDFSQGDDVLVLTAAREDLSVSERVLTPLLLRGSRGDADSNGNGYVSALELMTYIDGRLQLICPECDAELSPNVFVCPDCGATLKGENAVPRPQQGMFLDNDIDLFETSP